MSGDFEKALDKLNRELSDMPSDNPLRQARSRIQQQAFDNSVNKSHISILDMPTGSGKTLCSLKLALESGKKRIIYVIPYTSIIEQTANKFEKCSATFSLSYSIIQTIPMTATQRKKRKP